MTPEMNTPSRRNTGAVTPVVLASGVAALLDANDALERQLVDAAKTVSTSYRLEVRHTGEKVYRYLDVLNGKLEAFINPKALEKPKAKAELRQSVVKAQGYVAQLTKPLKEVRGVEALLAFLNDWTEQYLDFASQISASLGPDDLGSDEARMSKAA